jgi:NADH-quinone oxidoreductase subunit N
MTPASLLVAQAATAQVPIDWLLIGRQTLRVLLPEILIVLAATAIMTAGAFVRRPRRTWAGLSVLTLLAALGLLLLMPGGGPDPYASVVAHDALALATRIGLLLAGLIVLALAHDQVDDDRAPEFFGCLLFIHAGAMLVGTSNELVLLFLGLELVSIPTYFLLYLPRRTATTQEAATKYFFLSIFSSALLLFGLAYLYGLTGLSNLKALAYLIHWNRESLTLPQPLFATIALVFIMAGLAFRAAAVPFHFYAPDVYQGSPTVLAALLAWVPKVVGFVAMLRVLTAVFGTEALTASNLTTVSNKAVQLTWIVAAATLILGNTVALAQDNLKRLLAYSSIAHAGYLLIGITAAFRNAAGGSESVLGADSVVFYLATYALMTLGAFGVILLLDSRERPVETIDDLAGLLWARPWAAVALALCVFSLAGIPPLAGFWGKLRIFQAALEAGRGHDTAAFQALVVIGVLSAAIGAYYYLRIIVVMTLREPVDPPLGRAGWPTVLAVTACAVLSLFFGVYPAPLTRASRAAGEAVVNLPDPITTDAGTPPPTMAARPAPAVR